MSYFIAKMHQSISAGLRPRPCWGSLGPYNAHPDPLAGFKGLTSKVKKKMGREG